MAAAIMRNLNLKAKFSLDRFKEALHIPAVQPGSRADAISCDPVVSILSSSRRLGEILNLSESESVQELGSEF